MNLTRVLNVALPEIPARSITQRCPRVDPAAVCKEHIESGERVVRVYVPSAGGMYTFPSQNWALISLFDGKRSYREIAELFSGQTGLRYSEEQVREFADGLEAADFWYKTTQEKNVLLMQKSADERRRHLKQKSKYGDLSEILFPAFNPDKFLTWLDKYTSFAYTWWFTLVTLAGFGFAAGSTITHWSEIGRDTLEFYNFANKSWADVFQYYLLVIATVVIHEGAHGHACKHYGGRRSNNGLCSGLPPACVLHRYDRGRRQGLALTALCHRHGRRLVRTHAVFHSCSHLVGHSARHRCAQRRLCHHADVRHRNGAAQLEP